MFLLTKSKILSEDVVVDLSAAYNLDRFVIVFKKGDFNFIPGSILHSKILVLRDGQKLQASFRFEPKFAYRLLCVGDVPSVEISYKMIAGFSSRYREEFAQHQTRFTVLKLDQQTAWTEIPKKIISTGVTPSLLTADMGDCYQLTLDIVTHKKVVLNAGNTLRDDILSTYPEYKAFDAKLLTGDNFTDAHKMILCARSSVFKTMFESDMTETATNEIMVADFSTDTVRLFVKFLYTDQVDTEFLEQCAEQLLMIAHKYEVRALFNLCEHHMSETLTTANATNRLSIAITYNADSLRNVCMAYVGGKMAHL